MSNFSLLACATLLLAAVLPASASASASGDAAEAGFRDEGSLAGDRQGPDETLAAAEDTQALLDALARETRRLDAAAHAEVLGSLASEYRLGGELSDARKALALQERMLDLENRARAAAAALSPAAQGPAGPPSPEALALEKRRVAAARDLMQLLCDEQRDLPEDSLRQYRAWMMVWQGRLSRRQEQRDSGAVPPAPGTPVLPGLAPGGGSPSPPAAPTPAPAR